MLARLNNAIRKYETERDLLKVERFPSPKNYRRLEVINEILSALYSLKK